MALGWEVIFGLSGIIFGILGLFVAGISLGIQKKTLVLYEKEVSKNEPLLEIKAYGRTRYLKMVYENSKDGWVERSFSTQEDYEENKTGGSTALSNELHIEMQINNVGRNPTTVKTINLIMNENFKEEGRGFTISIKEDGQFRQISTPFEIPSGSKIIKLVAKIERWDYDSIKRNKKNDIQVQFDHTFGNNVYRKTL